MADIWILASNQDGRGATRLTRFDTITALMCEPQALTALQAGSAHPVVLAREGGTIAGVPCPPIPENFDVRLLHRIHLTRSQLKEGHEEDMILIPDLDDNGEWDWGSALQLSEMID